MKQGKIKAIPVTDPVVGQQIGYYNVKELVVDHINQINVEFNGVKGLVVLKKMMLLPLDIADLRQLVIEYEEKYKGVFPAGVCGAKRATTTIRTETKRIPLKYSQWQAAIDQGEVDSDKVIRFEEISDAYDYSPEGKLPTILRRWYARVIPAKNTCKADIAYKGKRLVFEGLSAEQAQALCALADQAATAGERRSALIPARKRVFTEADLAVAFSAGRAHKGIFDGVIQDRTNFLYPSFDDWFSII